MNFNANSRNFSIFPFSSSDSTAFPASSGLCLLSGSTTSTPRRQQANTPEKNIYQVISLKYINVNKIAKSFLLKIFPILFGNSFKTGTNGTFRGWAVCMAATLLMMMMLMMKMKSCCC